MDLFHFLRLCNAPRMTAHHHPANPWPQWKLNLLFHILFYFLCSWLFFPKKSGITQIAVNDHMILSTRVKYNLKKTTHISRASTHPIARHFFPLSPPLLCQTQPLLSLSPSLHSLSLIWIPFHDDVMGLLVRLMHCDLLWLAIYLFQNGTTFFDCEAAQGWGVKIK